MPNGSPFDDPLNDMLTHNFASRFPDDIFQDVRAAAAHPDFDQIRARVETLLFDNWPLLIDNQPDMDFVREELAKLRAEL